jgi:hypothetical protein
MPEDIYLVEQNDLKCGHESDQRDEEDCLSDSPPKIAPMEEQHRKNQDGGANGSHKVLYVRQKSVLVQ